VCNISAFYGVLFPDYEEAAFSNNKLWESVGLLVVQAYGSYIEMSIKLGIFLIFLMFGMTGFIVIEVPYKQNICSNHKIVCSR
jgi:hypothetical protein